LVERYQLFRGVCCLYLDAPSEKIFADSEGSPETMAHIYQTIPCVTSHMVFFIVTAGRTSNLTFFTFVPFASGQVPVLAGSCECGTEPLGFMNMRNASFSRTLLLVHIFKTDFS
jgi:hypothetical protein